MLTIRLTPDIEARLNRLSQDTGRTKVALAREAILARLDELEDVHLAETRARNARRAIALADVERDLGLAGPDAALLRGRQLLGPV